MAGVVGVDLFFSSFPSWTWECDACLRSCASQCNCQREAAVPKCNSGTRIEETKIEDSEGTRQVTGIIEPAPTRSQRGPEATAGLSASKNWRAISPSEREAMWSLGSQVGHIGQGRRPCGYCARVPYRSFGRGRGHRACSRGCEKRRTRGRSRFHPDSSR